MDPTINDVMSRLEVFGWVVGLVAMPIVGAGIMAYFTLMRIREDQISSKEHMKEMHRAATDTHQEALVCIRDNTRAITSLAHYIRWTCEHVHGSKPPEPEIELPKGR